MPRIPPGRELAHDATAVCREGRTEIDRKEGWRHPCPVPRPLARSGEIDVPTRIASPPVESPVLEDPRAEQAAAVWRLLEAARRVALAGLALDDVVAALVDQAT